MSFPDRLFIMVDIETSGPVYGRHSMTELGAAVGSRSRGVIDRFEALIRPIGEASGASRGASREAVPSGMPASIGDEVKTSRDSFARAKESGIAPATALRAFADWSKSFDATFVARPAAFDWPWIVYYAWTYLGENPFGFKALCASSWFEARGKQFRVELPHRAVEDAVLQLEHFVRFG